MLFSLKGEIQIHVKNGLSQTKWIFKLFHERRWRPNQITFIVCECASTLLTVSEVYLKHWPCGPFASFFSQPAHIYLTRGSSQMDVPLRTRSCID